jgi:3-oxoacyl-[acyl-carrier protein] reductase
MGEHDGKVALITGGGRGFGKAFGHSLTEAGAHVVLVDVDGEAAEQAAAEIAAAGGRATAQVGDVTSEADMARIVEATQAELGGIDILINNAGLHSQEYSYPMAELGLEKVRRLFEVNVMGTILCTMAAVPAMTRRSGASIVNISSSAAYPSGGAYGVSKLAVRGLTIAFARELAGEQIRVNAIAPGLIFTDTIRAELNPQSVGWVMSQQFTPVEGEEADIVEMMRYLVSDKAKFITGETFRVSGGFTVSI